MSAVALSDINRSDMLPVTSMFLRTFVILILRVGVPTE